MDRSLPLLEDHAPICSLSLMGADDDQESLEIEVQTTESRTMVVMAGELDASTAPYLYNTLSDLELTDALHVVLDLAKVSFMDSSGLAVILTEHKRLQHIDGTLTIFSPPSSIRRLFELTGLETTLDIVPANEER
jgi:anti-anti-sigma factor